MTIKSRIALIVLTILIGAGTAIASNSRTPVEFYKGHSHDGDRTVGAPEHSGGTDIMGCHNGSVPYHCH